MLVSVPLYACPLCPYNCLSPQVLLSAACQSWWVANSSVVVRLLTLCHQLAARSPCPATVATAAQAAACQAVRGFVAMLGKSIDVRI